MKGYAVISLAHVSEEPHVLAAFRDEGDARRFAGSRPFVAGTFPCEFNVKFSKTAKERIRVNLRR